jgi:hypothetical protein
LNKRQGVEDPFDQVSGSNGLAACADATLILDRDGHGVTLYQRGRDIEEVERALSFDRTTGRWALLGEADEVRRSDERKRIINVLNNADGPLSPTEVAALLGLPINNVKQLLFKMVNAGEVQKTKRGQYAPIGVRNFDNPITNEGDEAYS